MGLSSILTLFIVGTENKLTNDINNKKMNVKIERKEEKKKITKKAISAYASYIM